MCVCVCVCIYVYNLPNRRQERMGVGEIRVPVSAFVKPEAAFLGVVHPEHFPSVFEGEFVACRVCVCVSGGEGRGVCVCVCVCVNVVP